MSRDAATAFERAVARSRASSRRRGEPSVVARRFAPARGGAALQAVPAGLPTAVLVERAHRDSTLDQVTGVSVRLAPEEVVHSHAQWVPLILALLLFTGVSLLLARPLVTRRWPLLLAVPLAATIGVLAVGALALVLAAMVLLADVLDGAELHNLGWRDRLHRRDARRRSGPPRSR